jgi:hypothetical protein
MRFATGMSAFLANSNPNTIPHLTGEQLRGYRFPKPPHDEQAEIAEFLDTMTRKSDSLVAEAERAIELLQERRTALISAAVTGKIDVREFAPVSGKALAAADARTSPSGQNRRLAPCRSGDRPA